LKEYNVAETEQVRPRAPKLSITVTPDIIENAERRSSSHCMWADAVRVAFPTAKSVSVDLQTIRFTDPAKKLRYVYLTPRAAQISLVLFDQGTHTEPTTVTLRHGTVTKSNSYKKPYRKSAVPAMPDGNTVELQQDGHIVNQVGGLRPPVAALSNTRFRGKRRAFGLRAMMP
jgi:hypothetical protein